MPRDLPLSNGELLINFDKSYNLRDIYWPHVGQELHTAGGISRTGVWVSGQFAWLDAPEWQREMVYEQETLVTHVTLTHPGLQLKLVFNDTVDFARPIFLRHVVVTNLADRMREVRLFFHYDWHIWADVDGNTVFYYPEARALVAYKASGYFLMNGQILQYPLVDRRERENTMLVPTPPDARNSNATLLNMSSGFAIDSDTQAQIGISSWATGIKEFNGAEGTWRDAEDGELQRNPIAQGSVDGTLALHLPPLAAQASGEAYHWLTAGPSLSAVIELDGLIAKRGIQTFLMRTYNYWYSWVNKDGMYFADLPPELVKLYKQSLLVLRTQIDNGGAIVAANDADVSSFSRDSYSYMWPRDGALVANALSHAGYSETSRNFYDF
ncbi:MAG TPA: hypothetical protein VHV10_03110, partial [Ktedonobacteraceae bacterium]|nr:hypothetical protein [Ktedonobacteraceae bacterium]